MTLLISGQRRAACWVACRRGYFSGSLQDMVQNCLFESTDVSKGNSELNAPRLQPGWKCPGSLHTLHQQADSLHTSYQQADM